MIYDGVDKKIMKTCLMISMMMTMTSQIHILDFITITLNFVKGFLHI